MLPESREFVAHTVSHLWASSTSSQLQAFGYYTPRAWVCGGVPRCANVFHACANFPPPPRGGGVARATQTAALQSSAHTSPGELSSNIRGVAPGSKAAYLRDLEGELRVEVCAATTMAGKGMQLKVNVPGRRAEVGSYYAGNTTTPYSRYFTCTASYYTVCLYWQPLATPSYC